MDDRIDRLESAIRDLSARVLALEERAGAYAGAVRAEPGGAAGARALREGARDAARADAVAVLSLIGRTFIVFGGAYLLRAFTESGRLGAGIGAVLGILYAHVWLFAADRAAARGRTLDAALHGAAAALIAFPLVAEATLRFRLLSPASSAAAIDLLAGAFLLVAWARRHRLLAWIDTLAAAGAAIALLGATGAPLPFTVALAALGVGTLWIAYDRDWFALRWPTALAADLCVAGLTARALATPPREEPAAVIAVQIGLLGATLASIAARTLLRGRNVVPFEMVQSAAALGVGLGGAIAVTRSAASGTALLALSCLALAAGTYAVAFAFLDRRRGRGRNFYFYNSLAVVFALAGTGLSLQGGALAVTWAALGVGAAWLGARTSRVALYLHGAIYIAGAAIVSGLYHASVTAVFGPMISAELPSGAAMAVLAAAGIAATVPGLRSDEGWKDLPHLPRIVLLLTLVAGAGSVLIPAGTALLSARGGEAPPPALVATIRSIVLGLAALILALLARSERLGVARWFVYPLLAAAALKLVIEDLRLSSASGLFVALGAYGAALILAPRLLRRAAERRAAREGRTPVPGE